MIQEQDWQNLENETPQVEKMPLAKSTKIWNAIYAKTYKPRYLKQKIAKAFSIAAVFVLVIGIAYLAFKNQESNLQNVMFSLTNNSSKDVIAYMPDSSKIRLFPNSVVKYTYDEKLQQRQVTLKGKAVFDVFKDKAHPFFVHTEKIEVCAVGTIFLVDENIDSKDVSIKLFEGKIVVKNIISNKSSSHKQNSIEENLLAGESIEYKAENFNAPILKHMVAYVSDAKFVDIQSPNFIRQFIDNNYLNFNNEKLSKVLDVLSYVYKQNITYSKQALQDFYITASFKTTDSLQTILPKIAKINKLKIDKQHDNIDVHF